LRDGSQAKEVVALAVALVVDFQGEEVVSVKSD
jgi:hypothetical protein